MGTGTGPHPQRWQRNHWFHPFSAISAHSAVNLLFRKKECRQPRSHLHITPDWERDYSLLSGHLPQKSVERSQLKLGPSRGTPLHLVLRHRLAGNGFHRSSFFRARCFFIVRSALALQEINQVLQFRIRQAQVRHVHAVVFLIKRNRNGIFCGNQLFWRCDELLQPCVVAHRSRPANPGRFYRHGRWCGMRRNAW